MMGPLAEYRRKSRHSGGRLYGWFMGHSVDPAVFDGAGEIDGSDRFAIAWRLEWLARRTGCDRKEEFLRLWGAAWALVEIEWPGIDAISQDLVREGSMDGDAFEDRWRAFRPSEAVRRRRAESLGYEAAEELAWLRTPWEPVA